MKVKKIIALLLAATLLLGMTACTNTPGDNTETTGSQGGEKVEYTIMVQTAGGMAMEGVDIVIYADDTLEDIEQFGKTDANGQLSIQLPKKDGYVAVISGAPKGYALEASYPLTGANTVITLTSALIKDGNLADATLGLGDVMYDFTVTDTNGNQVTLSEMLKEKDVVLLNFWFSTCGPCASEFPYMDEAYQTWQESAGVIALNSYPTEDETTVKNYQASMGLTFPMAKCPSSWNGTFGITGYPTSIVVDRYGVICLIEVGGLTSVTPFNNIFAHFTGDNYQQKICYNGLDDITVQIKPTYDMPSSEEFSALNQGSFQVEYTPETGEGSEYSWPFILGEKNGEKVAYASNIGIDSSYAILYANVELKAGQAFGFDYLSSCANGEDILYVIVDGEDIYQISGVAENNKWEKCYPWVADRDGTHEIALCYLKDDGGAAGDDTVYVKNFRVEDASAIQTPTYIPRQAATSADGFDFTYVNVVYNEKDGYYHVGTADGPLLLASMNVACQFNEDKSVLQMISDGDITVDGKNYYEDILPYCSYASNSSLNGLCTVNQELAGYLKLVADVAGFTDDENEWLKLCSYYATYGTNGEQLQDPIAGLAPFSAYEAKLGKNVPTNFYYYDRVIMPRGTFAKFVPTKSGVYRITSRATSLQGVDGWIFNKDMEELTVYERDERIWSDDDNISMVYYMEKGQEYYIDICFWDLYETGYIYYDIEYISESYDHFRLASPGYFTYETGTGTDGETMYYTIAGGVTPVLRNGKYYVAQEGGRYNLLYADFSGYTPIFTSMTLQQVIENGGFNFTRTEDDEVILQYLRENENDPDKTRAALKEEWGDSYDSFAKDYKLEEVLAGKYHGTGEDMTAQARAYVSKMITSSRNPERIGCVEVDAALAELLQKLMDKYTFKDVDHSWIKLCYYYDYMGPA